MAELLAWAGTRILQWRIALLWLLVLAATFAAGTHDAAGWTLPITAALIVQFRLWDDLEDLPHDRLHAPRRVLVQCTSLRPFRLAFAASVGAVAVAFALWQSWPRVVAYLSLLAAMATLYLATNGVGARRALRTQLVLLKYAGFVLLLADDPLAPHTLAAAAALHVALAVHDWNEQRTAPPP